MFTKDNWRIYFLVLLTGVVFACGQKKEIVSEKPVPALAPVVVSVSTETKKIVLPQYYYQGEKYRDPFVPLVGGGKSAYQPTEIVPPNLGTLTLKGIITDSKGVSMAILSSGGISYFLKSGRLYDSQYRLIPGISGIVRKDRVTVIANGVKKELTPEK